MKICNEEVYNGNNGFMQESPAYCQYCLMFVNAEKIKAFFPYNINSHYVAIFL